MSLTARGFAAVALVAALTGLLAPAASGRAAAPQIEVFISDVMVAADSPGKAVTVAAGVSRFAWVENLVLEVDFSGLAGVATVTVDPVDPDVGCQVVGSIATCQLGTVDLNVFTPLAPEFVIVPAPGAQTGATGSWKATISADGREPSSMESSVTLAEGVDLSVPERHPEVTGLPDNVIPMPLQINNVGEKTVEGVAVLVDSDYPVVAAKQYSNCTYLEGHLTSCTFDERLEVATDYATHEAPLKLRPDAYSSHRTSFEFLWLTKAEFELFKRPFEPGFLGSPGTGDRLRLVENQSLSARSAPPQTDINDDSHASVTVNIEGDNGADLAAIGGSASGAVGQVVTLDLGLHNAGPATIDLIRTDDSAGVFDLTMPAGSSLAEMPERCTAMKQIGDFPVRDPDRGNLLARFIRCSNRSRLFIAGTDWTIPVKLRIDQVITGATGTVTVTTSECTACVSDKDSSNDTANVVLNPALPTTGVQTGLIAGSGALLAVAGLVFFVVGRRRKFKATDAN
jgi:hypothetical protein